MTSSGAVVEVHFRDFRAFHIEQTKGFKAQLAEQLSVRTKYLSDSWLDKWIKNPRSVRCNSAMPAFATHSNADALVEDVLTHSKTMARHKQKPQ
jgi:cbb3-type cytochrome oxidase cytochrome c subunit